MRRNEAPVLQQVYRLRPDSVGDFGVGAEGGTAVPVPEVLSYHGGSGRVAPVTAALSSALGMVIPVSSLLLPVSSWQL
jgi:hypothetical protein